MLSEKNIAIIGAGAWGTALAALWGGAGYPVILWARRAEAAAAMQQSRVNQDHLPGVILPPGVIVTHDFSQLQSAAVYIIALPAQSMLATLAMHRNVLHRSAPLIICSKGIDAHSHKLLPAILKTEFPHHAIGVLSGPNLAHEVARGLPAAATLAMPDLAQAQKMAQILSTPNFRLYASDDVTGAALGGALKNVIAIAAGIAAGAGAGENARAALVTRGLAELSRLGLAMGARAETLTGLSGLGDLMLTATAPTSRNYSLGYDVGQGKSVQDILATRHSVTEGVTTAAAALALAAQHNIELPICAAVQNIIQGKKIDTVLAELMARPLKSE